MMDNVGQLQQVKRFIKLTESDRLDTSPVTASTTETQRVVNPVLLVDPEELLSTLEKVKIYVYNLPEKFNNEIEIDIRAKHKSCIPTVNFGCVAGLTQHIDDLRFCFTNQFTSELILHQRLLTSRVSPTSACRAVSFS